MKKNIFFFTILCISFIACNQKIESDVSLEQYNKNLIVAKQFYVSFSTKDSITEASLLSDDFKWNGPSIGQDSLSKEAFMKGDKEVMVAYSDIKLLGADYYPGVDTTHKISSEVRVYGTWNFKSAVSGKTSKAKYYAVFKFNDAGKINELTELYNLEDMKKEL